MTIINKKKIEEFIRVDHAGERGAVKIYEGQLLALNTLVKDEALKKTIEEMKIHETEHSNYFEKEIKKRNIKPTKFLPLWDLLGVGLGFGSTLLGKKAAMLCTASVEEVIDEHYLNQIRQLDDSESKLKKKIIKFREDELNHKDIAYEKGARFSAAWCICVSMAAAVSRSRSLGPPMITTCIPSSPAAKSAAVA